MFISPWSACIAVCLHLGAQQPKDNPPPYSSILSFFRGCSRTVLMAATATAALTSMSKAIIYEQPHPHPLASSSRPLSSSLLPLPLILRDKTNINKDLRAFSRDLTNIGFRIYIIQYNIVAAQNLRASREKSGNHLLANPPTCYFKYVYIILDSQSSCIA